MARGTNQANRAQALRCLCSWAPLVSARSSRIYILFTFCLNRNIPLFDRFCLDSHAIFSPCIFKFFLRAVSQQSRSASISFAATVPRLHLSRNPRQRAPRWPRAGTGSARLLLPRLQLWSARRFVSQRGRRGMLCAADVQEVELSTLLTVPGG